MAALYVVATPIGNLGDLSQRAQDVLKAVALIAAEDTRVTRALLNHFDIHTPCVSNHRHNEAEKAEPIVARMLDEDIDVALVTDAGTPAISDPGSFLVDEAIRAGIPVYAVPGPNAMAAALSVSGFDTRTFAFYGFLPRKRSELVQKLREITGQIPIAVVHESPHRVIELVETICETLPGCRISASCDLTKYYEKTIRGTAEEVLSALQVNEKAEKGEYCLVLDLHEVQLDGALTALAAPDVAETPELQLFKQMLAGADLRAAMQSLRDAGMKRNLVYAAGERMKALFYENFGAEEDE
ncbi:MAG: 16S rRNA (cytidine(1402)-2'-O)-methyltransferase [Clostridia bacterium]|nr:16S rRNA (cytidine(1402)-2'-O)-methyltransferase [Clostridia bacterium]